jgi:hypothetical protein
LCYNGLQIIACAIIRALAALIHCELVVGARVVRDARGTVTIGRTIDAGTEP